MTVPTIDVAPFLHGGDGDKRLSGGNRQSVSS